MTDQRRRRIIKSAEPEAPGPDRFDDGPPPYDPGKQKFLERKVYVPMPLIFAGFVVIAVMSFTATYLIVKWPADLELPENQQLLAYREAAAETTLALRQAPDARPLTVEFPSADVEVMGFLKLRPEVRPDGFETPERAFSKKTVSRSLAPVADLGGLKFGKNPVAETKTAAIPEPARDVPFEKAATVRPPVADLAPGTFKSEFDVAAIATPGQRLLARRFAKAAVFPDAEGTVNLLTVPATGQGLPVRKASVGSALGAKPPVSDLEIAGLRAPGSVPQGKTQDQRLLKRRYAKAAILPEAGASNNPLTVPLEGSALETVTRSFSRAMGISDPAADVVLSAAVLPAAEGPATVPGQKLMIRRYAKATLVPERLPAAIPGSQPAGEPGFQPAPNVSDTSLEPWRRFAAAVPANIEGKGRIVIIIDDMGNNTRMAERLAALGGPLDFAFLPYAPNLLYQTALMRNHGHELLVHMPMEPKGDEDPGPKALTTGLAENELQETLDWNLSQFEGFVGVNNHMGSRFTTDLARMNIVMRTLKARGLLFLDSVTTSNSRGESLARSYEIPWAGRDIFLDNVVDEGAILAQLAKVEKLAEKRGVAIAIGHPHGATLKALQTWIPTLKAKGLVLVPLSSVVHYQAPRKLAGGGQG